MKQYIYAIIVYIMLLSCTCIATDSQETYTYDGMNRLKSENNVQYSFDDFGNRAAMTGDGKTTTYTYDLNNRLIQSIEVAGDTTTTSSFSYDPNGNQISKSITIIKPEGEARSYSMGEATSSHIAFYDYDCYNRLTGVDTNGVASTYTYLPDGMRHSKTVDGVTTTFVYDGVNIIEEVTPSKTNKYYRGIEIIKNGDGLFYLYNRQGDVAILTNAEGVVASYTFDAYGNMDSTGEVYNPFGYRGEYTDSESGLIYLRARLYDPETGRFINEDPIKDGLNWYIYCNNNPVNYIDPYGLDAVLITADHAASGFGHTSILTQDTRNGNWYYFYWGDKAAYFVEVPWEDGAMSSLNSFNSWLNGQDLPYSTKSYTSATFVEGDFNASVDYFQNLVNNTTIESGYEYRAGRYDKPTYEYYIRNTSYDLFTANCLQMSMIGFNKGTLKDGTSVGTFMKGQLAKTNTAGLIPNVAEGVFNQLFFNRRFTRADAKNDVAWESLYGSPSKRYKYMGIQYAQSLGVTIR